MTMIRTTIAISALIITGAFVLGCSEEETVSREEVCYADSYLEANMRDAPQICPRVNPVNLCEQYIPDDGFAELFTWELMLDNWGRGELEIVDFSVQHDRRCAFTEPNGSIELWDNDESDQFAATVRSRGAAFLRIQYRPPTPGEDGVTITINSNAENLPALNIYVCGGGTSDTTLSCQLRTDPACTPSGTACDVRNPCALACSQSGSVCTTNADCPLADEFCLAREYCLPFDEESTEFDPTNPTAGTCVCRPCAIPPDETWPNCGE